MRASEIKSFSAEDTSAVVHSLWQGSNLEQPPVTIMSTIDVVQTKYQDSDPRQNVHRQFNDKWFTKYGSRKITLIPNPNLKHFVTFAVSHLSMTILS